MFNASVSFLTRQSSAPKGFVGQTTDRYTPQAGRGWTVASPALSAFYRPSQAPAGPVAHYHEGMDETFRMDVPNGKYFIHFLITNANLKISSDDGTFITISGNIGQTLVKSMSLNVSNGRILLNFKTTVAGKMWRLHAIQVTESMDQPPFSSQLDNLGAALDTLPPVAAMELDKTEVVKGMPVVLSWGSVNSDKMSINGFSHPLSGVKMSYPAASQIYTTRAMKDGGYESVVKTPLTVLVPHAWESLPNAVLSVSNFPNEMVLNEEYDFTATVQGDSGSMITWFFGDGSSAQGNQVVHTYSNGGIDNIFICSISLKFSSGDIYESSRLINIVQPAPLPDIFIDGPVDEIIESSIQRSFRAVLAADHSKLAVGYHFKWEFGDGSVQEGDDLSQVSHAYTANGTYVVTLTSTPSQGQPIVDSYQVVVRKVTDIEVTAMMPGMFMTKEELEFMPVLV